MEQKSTSMPRAALPRSDRTEDIVFWIGLGVSALFAVVQVAFAVAFVPVMLYTYETAGLTMPWLLSSADALGPFGIIVVLGVLDLAVFAVFAGAARRYWTGLLFIPPLFYLLAAFTLFASTISGAALIVGR